MQAYRYATAYITALAGDTTQVELKTSENNKQRTITGIYSGDHTADVHTQIENNGKVLVDVDNTVFTTLNGLLPVSTVFDIGDPVFINLDNQSGGTITNAPITVQYSVNP